MAASKSINLSPSPANRRKANTAKVSVAINPSPKQKVVPASSDLKKTTTMPRKAPVKNIEVDTNELIESLKIE